MGTAGSGGARGNEPSAGSGAESPGCGDVSCNQQGRQMAVWVPSGQGVRGRNMGSFLVIGKAIVLGPRACQTPVLYLF